MDTAYQVIVDGKTGNDEMTAGHVMQALLEHYPGHPWHVEVRDGMVIVKHMRLSAKWAMAKRLDEVWSVSELKKSAIRAGGEFLERANLVRGRDRGDRIVHVDGIEKKDLLLG